MHSVAGGVQVYSVTNYSTCCFLLHLQLSQNYIRPVLVETCFSSLEAPMTDAGGGTSLSLSHYYDIIILHYNK